MRSETTILMYHRVLEDAECDEYPFSALAMPRSSFEAQLDYLCERTRVLPVAEALRHGRDAKPVVCLTFDDGYVDNFEIVAPMLEARGLLGTFFITAGAVQAQETLWYDSAADIWTSLREQEIRRRIRDAGEVDPPGFGTRQAWIAWLKGLPNHRRAAIVKMLDTRINEGAASCSLMTVQQVTQLAERGHEIGSHTLWHPILTTVDAGELRAEIECARQLLQEWTNREVSGFCYPNGDFNSDVVRQVREAGHSYACTTRAGSNRASADRFQLRRVDMTSDRVGDTDGRFDPLGFRSELSTLREVLRRSRL